MAYMTFVDDMSGFEWRRRGGWGQRGREECGGKRAEWRSPRRIIYSGEEKEQNWLSHDHFWPALFLPSGGCAGRL